MIQCFYKNGVQQGVVVLETHTIGDVIAWGVLWGVP